METANINIRVDKKLKKEAEELFDNLGLTMTAAMTMFLKRSLNYGGIPFEVVYEKPNKKTLDAMKEADSIMKDPKGSKSHSSFKELLKEAEEEIKEEDSCGDKIDEAI